MRILDASLSAPQLLARFTEDRQLAVVALKDDAFVAGQAPPAAE
jgi:hypothetical protein